MLDLTPDRNGIKAYVPGKPRKTTSPVNRPELKKVLKFVIHTARIKKAKVICTGTTDFHFKNAPQAIPFASVCFRAFELYFGESLKTDFREEEEMKRTRTSG